MNRPSLRALIHTYSPFSISNPLEETHASNRRTCVLCQVVRFKVYHTVCIYCTCSQESVAFCIGAPLIGWYRVCFFLLKCSTEILQNQHKSTWWCESVAETLWTVLMNSSYVGWTYVAFTPVVQFICLLKKKSNCCFRFGLMFIVASYKRTKRCKWQINTSSFIDWTVFLKVKSNSSAFPCLCVYFSSLKSYEEITDYEGY